MARGAGQFDDAALRHHRQAAGLSQQRVADLTGSTRWQVIAYEQGRAVPEPGRLAALARAIGCPATALSGTAPGLLDLAGLRRAAGLTRAQAAARLAELLSDGTPASKWMLEQAETGQLPVAWRFTARRAVLVAAIAQVYGHPVPVIAAAWGRAFPPLTTDDNLNPDLS
jgi:transcriptional regulator with XRE-family HTH domain